MIGGPTVLGWHGWMKARGAFNGLSENYAIPWSGYRATTLTKTGTVTRGRLRRYLVRNRLLGMRADVPPYGVSLFQGYSVGLIADLFNRIYVRFSPKSTFNPEIGF
jgi:hypothetical protein